MAACSSSPALAPALTVAFAPTKGERPEWVVQKLTELGIDRIVPLVSERSVVRWEGGRGQKAVERLRRVAREAAAQCRRVWLPEITDVVHFADLSGLGATGEVVLAQLSGDRPRRHATGGGGRTRRRLERGRTGLGPADRRLRSERLAGRDGGRHRRSADGLAAHGYGGAGDSHGRIVVVAEETVARDQGCLGPPGHHAAEPVPLHRRG